MLHTRMTTFAFILSELFPLDLFQMQFGASLCNSNTLWYIMMTLYNFCRTGHDDVSHTGIKSLACILSELFPLVCLSCNALYFEYYQDYFHETIWFCRRGRDSVLCIQNMVALMFIPPVTNPLPLPPPPPPPPTHQKKKFLDLNSLSKFTY